jgi:hypothetical protein
MAQLPVSTGQFGLYPLRNDQQQELQWKAAAELAAGLGLAGVDWISDSSAHTGTWLIFHAVTDCVISALTYVAGRSTGSASGVTVKAGDRLYGPITGVTLTSGTAELYRSTANPLS